MSGKIKKIDKRL